MAQQVSAVMVGHQGPTAYQAGGRNVFAPHCMTCVMFIFIYIIDSSWSFLGVTDNKSCDMGIMQSAIYLLR